MTAPARSLSTQHITSAASGLASSRSPSMRRMRQLLELESVRAGAPSPVPTPSGTLPRSQRQLDINPAGRENFYEDIKLDQIIL